MPESFAACPRRKYSTHRRAWSGALCSVACIACTNVAHLFKFKGRSRMAALASLLIATVGTIARIRPEAFAGG
jgi:hypothetical protein